MRERLLHYETNVDIKQGTDRMTSGVADVYLQKETNEVERTIAQKNVTIIQPGRRGTGDWCQYTTADEVAVLTGKPAHVEDAEQGTTDGNRLTMYRRENRVVADDTRGSQSPGRVRSTHKITKPYTRMSFRSPDLSGCSLMDGGQVHTALNVLNRESNHTT